MIISTLNAKGGVGKSTIAVHLAAWLHEHNNSTALIDCDVQRSSFDWISEAIPNLPTLKAAAAEELIDYVNKHVSMFTYMVIDGPAGISELIRGMMLVSDLILIPCGPSALDLRAASIAVDVVQRARSVRDGKPDALFVLNRMQKNTRLAQDLQEASKALGIPVAQTALYLRQVYADAPGQGSLVWRMRSRGRDATRELDTLFGEVIYGRSQALTHRLTHNEASGLFEKRSATNE